MEAEQQTAQSEDVNVQREPISDKDACRDVLLHSSALHQWGAGHMDSVSVFRNHEYDITADESSE